jgi:hypothetical protein
MENRLTVLWTTGDPVTVEKMVFMYTLNAKVKGWFEEVTLVIWGGSAKLLAGTPEYQKRIEDMQAAGINVEACKACADQLGVTASLENCSIDVKYWGEPLTEVLKNQQPLLVV